MSEEVQLIVLGLAAGIAAQVANAFLGASSLLGTP